jgi:hypothetical protein
MKPYASYIAPSPSPLPPSGGGEDKGEGSSSIGCIGALLAHPWGSIKVRAHRKAFSQRPLACTFSGQFGSSLGSAGEWKGR